MIRKRTNSKVPAKGRLRDIADKLWSLAVRADWNWSCAVCGKGKTEAHHILPRQHQATRYTLRNGIALCATHHQFDPDVSPHQTTFGFTAWINSHYPEVGRWATDTEEAGDHKRFDGTTNADYYIGIIRGLREYVEAEDYDRIVGKKFGAYLETEGRGREDEVN